MMAKSTKIHLKDVAPRTIADFLVIHVAMLLSFEISAVYQVPSGSSVIEVASAFRSYYFSWFILLSPLFPLIFFFNGLYTHARYYPHWRKLKRFITAVLMALAFFVTANFFLLPARNPIGRSVALFFVPLAIAGLVGIRLAKEWLIRRERANLRVEARAVEGGPILVIGGAGYIGCWLVRRLLAQGRKVRVLEGAVYGIEPIQDLLEDPNLEYQQGDCRNIQDVVKAMRGVSSVVHLAAIVGDPACEVDRNTAIEINYAATRMLVEIAKGNGVGRFLFASSCSVYGATDELMDEGSAILPISLYGETKEASERALLEAADDNFHPVIMRFATVFGLSNRPRFDLVVNLLTAKACQDGMITVFNGQQWRPFVHVKDLTEAMMLILQAPLHLVAGQVFNVGDNRLNHTLAQVADIIQKICPDTRVEYIENADRRNYRVKFDKIEKELGFRCQRTLEEGVQEIKSALETNEIASYKHVRFSNLSSLKESGAPSTKSKIDRDIMAAFAAELISMPTQEVAALSELKSRAAGASS